MLQRADQAIADLFTSIANQLAGLGEAITGKVKPQVSINPTVLFNNGAANISTNLAGASAAVSTLKLCCAFLGKQLILYGRHTEAGLGQLDLNVIP